MTANLICDSNPKWIHFWERSQTLTIRIYINNQFKESKVNNWDKITSWQISWCERHKFEFHLNWCNSKIRWNEPIFRHLGGKFPTIGCFCYWEVLLYPQQLKFNSQMNQFTASLCESFAEPISTRFFFTWYFLHTIRRQCIIHQSYYISRCEIRSGIQWLLFYQK